MVIEEDNEEVVLLPLHRSFEFRCPQLKSQLRVIDVYTYATRTGSNYF